MKKTLVLASAITAVGVSTFAGAGMVMAHNNQAAEKDTLSAQIAKKFNLNEKEVGDVIKAHHAQHKAEHSKKMQERIDQAVKDGRLTQDQAAQLKAKHAEMKAEREKLRDMAPEERRAAMEKKAAEFQKWADENNIPQEFRMMRAKFEKKDHHSTEDVLPLRAE